MYSNYRKRRCPMVGGVTVRGGRGGSGARRSGTGEAERSGEREGRWQRAMRCVDARDGNKGAGAGAGTEGEEQRCRCEGGHGQDRSVGAEADTDRTGVSARRRARAGQDKTDDSMTVSKHKLICEEKRERKQKRRGHAIIYRTRLGRQDLSNNNNPTKKNRTRSTSVRDHGRSLDPSE